MKKIKEIIEGIKAISTITILPILASMLAEYLGNIVTIQFIMTLIGILVVIAGIVLVKIEMYETKMKKAAKRRKQIQIFDF